MEKVYSYEKRKWIFWIPLGILFLFLFLLFLAGRAAMGAAPLYATILMNFVVIMCIVYAIIFLLYPFVLYPLVAIREIVFSEEGIFFKRGFRPITIQKITDLKVVKIIFGKKERGLKIVGLTPDGKKVRRPISRVLDGDVDKRWEEFKKDLQKYLME